MAYSFQTFSLNQILTSAQMNQVEVNVRDHVHGRAGTTKTGIAFPRTARSVGFSVAASDVGEWFDVTMAATATFAASSALGAGFGVYLGASGVNVTIAANGSETVDGSTVDGLTVGQNFGRLVLSDGSNLRTLQAGPWKFLRRQTASAVAQLDFVNLQRYRHHLFVASSLVPATDGAALQALFSIDNGSTFLATNYRWTLVGRDSTPGAIDENDVAAASIRLINDVGSAATEGVSATVEFHAQNVVAVSTLIKTHARGVKSNGQGMYNDGFGMWDRSAGSANNVVDDVDAIRFRFSAGNITSGTIDHYVMEAP